MMNGTTSSSSGAANENDSLLESNDWVTASDGRMYPVHQYGGGGGTAYRNRVASGGGAAENNSFMGFLPRMSFAGISPGNVNHPPSPTPSHIASHDTVIVAPANGELAAGTPLLGSSKLVANARHNELRRSMSRASMARSRSASMASHGSFARLRNLVNEWTATDDDEDVFVFPANPTAIVEPSEAKKDVCTLEESESNFRSNLKRTNTTFYQDAMTFAEGTIPQSIVIAIVIGFVCGVVAYVYYST